MTALPAIEIKRSSSLACALSAFFLLLLAWHVSTKVNANENPDLALEQNVVAIFDINVGDHDFDWGIAVESSVGITCLATSTNFSVIPSLYQHQTDVPQSRAPPFSL